MKYEIERKFLVNLTDAAQALQEEVTSVDEIEQAYLVDSAHCEVRIRLKRVILPLRSAGSISATLTAKGPRKGATRAEPESSLDPRAARDMISLAPWPRLKKLRHKIPAGDDLFWEVDVYTVNGRHFAVAEIELPSEDHEFERPSWLDREVTGEPEWDNINIAKRMTHGEI